MKKIIITKEQLRTIIDNEYPNLSDKEKIDMTDTLLGRKSFKKKDIQDLAESKVFSNTSIIKSFEDIDKIENLESKKQTNCNVLKWMCLGEAIALSVLFFCNEFGLLNFEFSWIKLSFIAGIVILSLLPFIEKVSYKDLEVVFKPEKSS